MLTQTQKDRAERKVEIAINKMIDLQQDFDISEYNRHKVGRILDLLNELENSILAEYTK